MSRLLGLFSLLPLMGCTGAAIAVTQGKYHYVDSQIGVTRGAPTSVQLELTYAQPLEEGTWLSFKVGGSCAHTTTFAHRPVKRISAGQAGLLATGVVVDATLVGVPVAGFLVQEDPAEALPYVVGASAVVGTGLVLGVIRSQLRPSLEKEQATEYTEVRDDVCASSDVLRPTHVALLAPGNAEFSRELTQWRGTDLLASSADMGLALLSSPLGSTSMIEIDALDAVGTTHSPTVMMELAKAQAFLPQWACGALELAQADLQVAALLSPAALQVHRGSMSAACPASVKAVEQMLCRDLSALDRLMAMEASAATAAAADAVATHDVCGSEHVAKLIPTIEVWFDDALAANDEVLLDAMLAAWKPIMDARWVSSAQARRAAQSTDAEGQ